MTGHDKSACHTDRRRGKKGWGEKQRVRKGRLAVARSSVMVDSGESDGGAVRKARGIIFCDVFHVQPSSFG